jgi:hypothetical protein
LPSTIAPSLPPIALALPNDLLSLVVREDIETGLSVEWHFSRLFVDQRPAKGGPTGAPLTANFLGWQKAIFQQMEGLTGGAVNRPADPFAAPNQVRRMVGLVRCALRFFSFLAHFASLRSFAGEATFYRCLRHRELV